MPVVKRGNLTKQGGASNTNPLLKSFSAMSWKRRYFEFDGDRLTYFKSETERERLGEFDLTSGFSVAEAPAQSKQENVFEIGLGGTTHLLAADSRKEMLEWIETLGKYAGRGSSQGGDAGSDDEGANLNVDMKEILQSCTLKGRLNKLGAKVTRIKQWRKRWFVLHQTHKLYYLKNLEDPRPLGVIDLTTCSECKSADEELNSQFTFVIHVPGRAYYCQGENGQEVHMWMSAIGGILQALVERQMKLFLRTTSQPGSEKSSRPPSRSSSSDMIATAPTSRPDSFDPSKESLDLGLGSDKSDAALNAYLKVLDAFDDDDDDDDDDADDADADEAYTKPLAKPGATAGGAAAPAEVDDSTKNLMNTLFRLNSIASKVMKYYSKLVGSDYLVRVLGPVITDVCGLDDAMEVDPSKVGPVENAEGNKRKLVSVCQRILTAILSSQKAMPNEMVVMCRHLYLDVEKQYPGHGPRQVGGYLFLRFFCPAIVQPNAHGVVRPDLNITQNTKRCLLLITKVLQNLSNGILFGTKELYMGGPLNDFIQQNIPVLNKFFASFVDMDYFTAGMTPIAATPTNELKSAAALLVTNLRFAAQLDKELPTRLGTRNFDDLSDVLGLSSPEPDQVAQLLGRDCIFVSAVCSTMKPTQIDSLAEALVILYCRSAQVVKLLKWVITDEVAGTGLTAKKFDVANIEGGEVKPVKVLKAGYLTKLGGNFKTWRKRWFVLTEDALSYYKSKDDEIPIQSIEMRVCSSIKYVDEAVEGGGFGFLISTPGRVFKFAADTDQERIQWIEAIKPFVEKGLLANLVKARKQSASIPNKRNTLVGSPSQESPVDLAKLAPRTRMTVDRAMQSLNKEGWLVKKGGTFKSWQKRWFILKNGYLVYYKDEQKGELLGLIDFEECIRVESAEAKMNTPRCFEVSTSSKTFHLIAETEPIMQAWIAILRQVMYHFKPALVPQAVSPSLSAKDLSGAGGNSGPGSSPASPSLAAAQKGRKPVLEGWLTKQGGSNKNWKNRWFVLRESSLLYFENSTDSLNESLAKGVISLDDAEVQIIEDHKFSFCFAVATAGRVYFLLAKDRADLEKWTRAIEGQTRHSVEGGDVHHAKRPEFLSKYQNAIMDRWNSMANQKPTVRVGAAELSQGSTCGYLMKASKSLTDKSTSVNKWRYRYFVLRNHCLYYFKTTLDEEALGTIELANIEVERIADNAEACAMLNNLKGQKFWQRAMGDTFSQNDVDYNHAVANKVGFLLKGRTKKFYLLAESEAVSKMWITAIKETATEWEALLEKAGVSEDLRKDAGTAKFVQQFIRNDARSRTKSIIELSKDTQLTSELNKALAMRASSKLTTFQEESSDESSGDEGGA